MQINLSNGEIVTLKEALTWGDSEQIQAALQKGAKMAANSKTLNKDGANIEFDSDAMLEAKYVSLAALIVSIEKGEEKKEFSREWMNELTKEDGDKIMDAVDELTAESKKAE